MRVPAALIAMLISLPLIGADSAPQPTTGAATDPHATCVRTNNHFAQDPRHNPGGDRSERLQPQKLNQLPGGIPYMAVYRHIGGCEAPLTMVEYRKAHAR